MQTVINRLFVILLLALVGSAPGRSGASWYDGIGVLAASQPQAPQQQDEFVPISELPPQERLPAAPLLIAAYVFVLAVLFLYLTSVARRLSGLQRDITRLEADLAKRGRS